MTRGQLFKFPIAGSPCILSIPLPSRIMPAVDGREIFAIGCGQGLEQVIQPADARPRLRAPIVASGALLLAGALALGGGSALLVWGLIGLARWPVRVVALVGLYLLPGLALLRLLW